MLKRLIVFSGILLAVLSVSSFAAVPKVIDFQGKLTNQYGTPEMGDKSLTFKLYTVATVGIATWEEGQTVNLDDAGQFSAILGSNPSNPLNVDFSQPLWLEIIHGTDTFVPRQRLTSTPYAFYAITAESVAGGGESSLWTSLGDNIYNTNPGNVGIGTMVPTAMLQVVGSAEIGDLSCSAIGLNSIAMGTGTIASGNGSTAMGNFSAAGGTNSVAMGDTTVASGNNSTAMGINTYAHGTPSLAAGMWVSAEADNTIAFGRGSSYFNNLNNNIPDSLMVGFGGTSPILFVSGEAVNGAVGIGTTDATSKLTVAGTIDAMDYYKNGVPFSSGGGGSWTEDIGGNKVYVTNVGRNVGIGTTDPGTKLHVGSGNIRIDDGYQLEFSGIPTTSLIGTSELLNANDRISLIEPQYCGTDKFTISYRDGSGASNSELALIAAKGNLDPGGAVTFYTQSFSTGFGQRMIINGAGNVGIGTTDPGSNKLKVAGNVDAAGLSINGVPVGSSTDTYWSSGGGGNIYYNSGNVGIGTVNPTVALKVVGSAEIGDASCSAIGANSVAMGFDTTASGNYSTAMGIGTIASGMYSTAMGRVTIASGGGSSIAMGKVTIASGESSTAMGNSTIASGSDSTIIGKGFETYMGRIYLENNIPSSFMVGYMNSETDVTPELFVKDNAVGIGTTDPAATLDVNGNVKIGANGFTISDWMTFGSWINIPTTGPSGIGSGGAGVNPWIAYAAGDGQWFTNALAGDIAYRNTSGKLLFGNSTGSSAMAITDNKVGIGTTNPTGKLQVTTLEGATPSIFVDPANGNVGIGTPDAGSNKLKVTGNVDATGFSIDGVTVGSSHDTYWSSGGGGNINYNLGSVGIGTTSPGATLEVAGDINASSGKIQEGSNALIPRGVIVMWSGATDNIPAGWALCNGTNGTPDLRDRFIVGAGTTYAVSAEGGTNTFAISTANLPPHTHSDGTYTAASAGAHTHNLKMDGTYEDDQWAAAHGGNYNHPGVGSALCLSAGAHTHDITGSSGNGGFANTSIENRPPYFALAYIMKL